jgi:hypothetical protein
VKRPAFQFYPADWRKDSALQSCGMAARGLWHEMMCIMHECVPYGHLAINGQPMSSAQLSRLVGEAERNVTKWLAELKAADVYSVTDDGVIYSRRMVKDEQLRNTRSEAGRLGGNPILLNQKVNQTDNHNANHSANHSANQSPTPSSSSSSSSQKRGSGKPDLHTLIDLGVDEQTAKDWMLVRKAKRAPLTETALEELTEEAEKAGISVGQAVAICARRNWQGFKASWDWRTDETPAPKRVAL